MRTNYKHPVCEIQKIVNEQDILTASTSFPEKEIEGVDLPIIWKEN